MQAEYGVLSIQPQSEVAVKERLTVTVVDQKHGRTALALPDEQHRITRCAPLYELRQPRNRRRRDECAERELDAERARDLAAQVQGEHRIAAELEEIIVPSYPLDAQQCLPDPRKGHLDLSLGCLITPAQLRCA